MNKSGPLKLLRDRRFGPFFAGGLLSNVGSWFHNVAAAIVVFELTRSALMVGAVVSAQFIPPLLLFPWTGLLTDRSDRRLVLMVSQVISGLAAGVLSLVVAVNVFEGEAIAWVILVASAFMGIGKALAEPSMSALIPALVPRRELDQAIALNNITFQLARAVGPALGALVLVVAGPAMSFGVNASTYIVFAVVLTRIRPLGPARAIIEDHSLKGGFTYLSSNRVALVLLASVAAISFGTDPVNTLSPVLAEQLVGDGIADLKAAADRLVGFMISAYGSGAAIAAFSLHRFRRRFDLAPLGGTGLVLTSLGMLGLAISPTVPLSLLSLGVAGFGSLLAVTTFTTLLQFSTTESLRGRVMAIWGVAFLGTRPLAALIDGGMADIIGARIAVVILAVIPVVTLIAMRPAFPAMRKVQVDESEVAAGESLAESATSTP